MFKPRVYYNVGTGGEYHHPGPDGKMYHIATMEKFGERIELPENVPIEPGKGGPKVLNEANWKSCGFTAAELDRHQWFGTHADASKEFKAKLRKAYALLHQPQHDPTLVPPPPTGEQNINAPRPIWTLGEEDLTDAERAYLDALAAGASPDATPTPEPELQVAAHHEEV